MTNSTDNPSKKPGGLLDQYNLLGAIIDTSWATRLDHKVARHVIDRYYPKHGNGRASLRYLEKATGALRPSIIASLRRLADNGAIMMVRQGQGTRPTEYALNFEFPSSGIAGDTTSNDSPSGIVGNTSGGIVDDTSTASSGIAGDTESYLQNPAYKAGLLIDRVDPAAPTAPPPADGLTATAAGGTAVEERVNSQAEDTPDSKPTFERCWRTYGFARGKKAARAAWNALPVEVDRAAVIRAAAAWQASWAAQGKPDAPRKHLASWLTDECYDEDAPKGFTKAERGKSKSKATKPAGLGIGKEIKLFTITDFKYDGDPFGSYFETLTFRAEDGQEFTRRLHVVQSDAEFGEGADAETRNQIAAAAFGKGNQIEEWVGRVVGVTDAEGLAFHHVAQPEPWVGDVDRFAPFGTFSTKIIDSDADHNEHGHFVTLMLEVSDTSGGMEIIRQVNHAFDIETMKGRAFLVSICRALGIDSIDNTDVLHGKVLECTITTRGEISYAASTAPLQEAA